MTAVVSRVAMRPDGRWEVEISVSPGRRAVTTLPTGPPPPDLVEDIRRRTEERLTRPGQTGVAGIDIGTAPG